MGNILITFFTLVSTVVFTNQSEKSNNQGSLDYAIKNIEVIKAVKQHLTPTPQQESTKVSREEKSEQVDSKDYIPSTAIVNEPSLYIYEENSSQANIGSIGPGVTVDSSKFETPTGTPHLELGQKEVGGIAVPEGTVDSSQPGFVDGEPPAGYEVDAPTFPPDPGKYIPIEIEGPGSESSP